MIEKIRKMFGKNRQREEGTIVGSPSGQYPIKYLYYGTANAYSERVDHIDAVYYRFDCFLLKDVPLTGDYEEIIAKFLTGRDKGKIIKFKKVKNAQTLKFMAQIVENEGVLNTYIIEGNNNIKNYSRFNLQDTEEKFVGCETIENRIAEINSVVRALAIEEAKEKKKIEYILTAEFGEDE